jgi:AcrR family transcriptional regulator
VRTTGVKAKVDRAAVELFAARGVDGVSIADIAAAAGISQGALYRHYRSKDDMAARLFAEAYRHAGEELTTIGAASQGFTGRIRAMIEHFCGLYDADPALFRFMLLAQHDVLPDIDDGDMAPVAAIEAAIEAAIAAGEIAAVDIELAAAAIMGIVLQSALFHLYGRLTGPFLPRAPALARAAIAAVEALGEDRSTA